jgi:hypothetical protein
VQTLLILIRIKGKDNSEMSAVFKMITGKKNDKPKGPVGPDPRLQPAMPMKEVYASPAIAANAGRK